MTPDEDPPLDEEPPPDDEPPPEDAPPDDELGSSALEHPWDAMATTTSERATVRIRRL